MLPPEISQSLIDNQMELNITIVGLPKVGKAFPLKATLFSIYMGVVILSTQHVSVSQ